MINDGIIAVIILLDKLVITSYTENEKASNH